MTIPHALLAHAERLTAEQLGRWIDRGWLLVDQFGEITNPEAVAGLIAADLLDPPEADTHTASGGPIRSTSAAPSSPADSRGDSR